jgi:hypothetical protein
MSGMKIPGLRSPYEKVGGLVYFGRMLDKIRLHAAGQLPPDYASNLGEADWYFFDARCVRFLGVKYKALVKRVQQGGTDTQILRWCFQQGGGARRSRSPSGTPSSPSAAGATRRPAAWRRRKPPKVSAGAGTSSPGST